MKLVRAGTGSPPRFESGTPYTLVTGYDRLAGLLAATAPITGMALILIVTSMMPG